MNAWDYAKNVAEKQQAGVFVRLKNDGDKVIGAVVGDPHVSEHHWTGEKYVECTVDGCAECKAGNKAGAAIRFNLFVPAENAMKVLEGPMKLFSAILAVRDKYGTDNDCFEITRHGKAKDPKTTYSALPDRKIDPAMREKIRACKLHDLARAGKSGGDATPEQAPAASPAPEATDERVSPAVAQQLIARLKVLPRTMADDFFQAFGIKRVREVRAADEKRAVAWIARAEESLKTPATDEDDEDDFRN